MVTNYFSFFLLGNESISQPPESKLVFEIALINGMKHK